MGLGSRVQGGEGSPYRSWLCSTGCLPRGSRAIGGLLAPRLSSGTCSISAVACVLVYNIMHCLLVMYIYYMISTI